MVNTTPGASIEALWQKEFELQGIRYPSKSLRDLYGWRNCFIKIMAAADLCLGKRARMRCVRLPGFMKDASPSLFLQQLRRRNKTRENKVMAEFHFRPDKYPLLVWFTDSPDAGDPRCLCSYCLKRIEDPEDSTELALRVFSEDNKELRMHMDCAREVIIELAPRSPLEIQLPHIDSQYLGHPAFTEGVKAFVEDQQRGSNPYAKSGPDKSRLAWYAGWDEAWRVAHE
jgi:hypothetical protein